MPGNTFSNYSTYFFQQAGLTGSIPYDFAMGQYAINMVGTIGAWGLMSLGIGRRRLFLCGLGALAVSLFVMGFLGLGKASNENATSLATGSMMLVWATCYQLSVG